MIPRISGIIQSAGGVIPPEPTTWAYPLPTAATWTDHGPITTHSGWDLAAWNLHGQSIVPVGSTCHLYYEAGNVWVTEHAEQSKLGVLSSTNGTSWSEPVPNPIAVYLPRIESPPGTVVNPNEEGYWYHAVHRRSNDQWTCVFGGQQGATANTVDIHIYMQTSSNGLAWTPNTHVGQIRIIDVYADETVLGPEGGGGSADREMGPGGLWYDEVAGIWHMIYTSKNITNAYQIYHVQGETLQTLDKANATTMVTRANNPYVTGQTMRPGPIVDRGNGVVDVLFLALDNAAVTAQKGAICRLPILPDYSWTAPGPAEILYYMSEDFSINAAVRPSVGFFPAVSKALLPYAQFTDQDLRLKSATAVQTSDGRLPYTPVSARFTSANSQYMSRAALTGRADSKLVTAAFSIKILTGGVAHKIFRLELAGSARFEIYVGTLNRINLFGRNSSATTILSFASPDNSIVVGQWHRVVLSLDMASYTLAHLYIDRVSAKPGSATYTNDLIDFGGADAAIFGRTTAATPEHLDAEIADFGFLPGFWFDLSDARVLDRFLTPANELQNPGYDGRRMFLRKPVIYFSGGGGAPGGSTAFATNKGTGGAFVASGGNLTTGASAPPGHP